MLMKRKLQKMFIRQIPYPITAASMRNKAKKKKRIRAEDIPSTPTQSIDARMGKRRKEQKTEGKIKERNREQGPQPSYLDHLVASYNLHRSYSRLILKHPHPQGNKEKSVMEYELFETGSWLECHIRD